MGGMVDSEFLERNNFKVQEVGLFDSAAPSVEVIAYIDTLATQVLCAQLTRHDVFEAGRQLSKCPSPPGYVDLASATDWSTPRNLVSFQYTVEGNVIFTAKRIGNQGWLPRFTVADGTPLNQEQNELVIASGKDTHITCVLIEGDHGDHTIDFVFIWPKRQAAQSLERQSTQFFPAASSSEDDPTFPYTPAADMLGSEATTPRDAKEGASGAPGASGASGASGFQWRVDTTAPCEKTYMTPFKAHVMQQANAETVTQWQTDALAHAVTAENKKTFAGMCLAFVMKQFKVAMTDPAVKSTVEARMQTHNATLTKPLTKKEKKDKAEEEKQNAKKAASGKKAGKRRSEKAKTSASDGPVRKKGKAGAAKKGKASASESSYQDSSDSD